MDAVLGLLLLAAGIVGLYLWLRYRDRVRLDRAGKPGRYLDAHHCRWCGHWNKQTTDEQPRCEACGMNRAEFYKRYSDF